MDLLHFFMDFIRNRSAYYLDPNIIRPLTRKYQLSFAELVTPPLPMKLPLSVSEWRRRRRRAAAAAPEIKKCVLLWIGH